MTSKLQGENKMPNLGAPTPEEYALADHSSRGRLLMEVHWSLASFATAFLMLRLHVKVSFRKGKWWDDWILVGGWVSGMPISYR